MQESFEQSCVLSTVRIETQGDASLGSSGTGFLYHAAFGTKGKSITLLISNRHVIGSPSQTIHFKMNRQATDGSAAYGDPLRVTQRGFEHVYYGHPNPTIDLACVNASSAQNERPSFRPVSRDFLEPLDESRLYASQDVVFVGYPDGIFDAKHNLPLIRKGSIASVPSVDFNGLGQIIIDAQVFKGSSGSPVFVAIDGSYRLLGVVSQNFVSDKQLDPIPLDGKGKHAKMRAHLGLGVVIKQRHVIELIDGAVERHMASIP